MPFAITIRRSFAASHQLRLADGTLEPLHGHNWRVALTVARPDAGLDAIGTVHDFHAVAAALEAVTGTLHNRHLNDLPAFDVREGNNPTTEHVARHVGQAVRLPAELRVEAVEVWETDDCSATWRP